MGSRRRVPHLSQDCPTRLFDIEGYALYLTASAIVLAACVSVLCSMTVLLPLLSVKAFATYGHDPKSEYGPMRFNDCAVPLTRDVVLV